MNSKNIPSSPSAQDYEAQKRSAIQKAHEADIFSCEAPFDLFHEWLADANQSEINDPNTMSVATVDETGLPDVRMVLLKDVDERGFVFYTNSNSAKGQQLQNTPKAALCFHWKSLRRQIRARGVVERVSDEESDDYFKHRSRGSQIGAWASLQSSELGERAALEDRVREVEAQYEGKAVPRPPHWYGWRIIPQEIEFWRDKPYRLHDRLVFWRETSDQDWARKRLYP